MNESMEAAQAELCKTFTHPTRIALLEALGAGERSVSELVSECGVAQPTVSQHLSVLRQVGVVVTRRVGTSIRYRVADARILQACHLMRSVLIDRMRRHAKAANAAAATSRKRGVR